MKAAYYTLGCKVNQYDTQIMREQMESAGYETVPFTEMADVYVINTCTVTQISDKKSKQMIRRVKRLAPQAILVVCGCFSQVAPEEAAGIEGVNIVLGVSNRKNILQYVEQYKENETRIVEVNNADTLEKEQIRNFEEKTRAIVKIEDGCDSFCSYCLIPYARGRVRSKPLDVLKKEVRGLAAAGFKEIVLTGIHLGSYGKDFGETCLEKAITAAEEEGAARIRLGSLEPRIITESFVSALCGVKALCPHFHLSLQSGSDPVLKRMNRRYTVDRYRSAVGLLRKAFPDCAITTDLIVGFPGETEQNFEESLQFMQEIGFAKVHIFPYSPRKGTAAAKMPDQISPETKAQRVKLAEAVELSCRTVFWESMIGKRVIALPEEIKGGAIHGFTENYSPIRWQGPQTDQPVELTVCGTDSEGLTGNIIKEQKS